MNKTIFQRIIDREIPATVEFENDEIIAIRDIAPVAALHILIIPKKVIIGVNTLEDQDHALVGRVFLIARDLAKKHGLDEGGYRIVTNCGDNAGQTVSHLHFHLLGGEPLGAMVTALATKRASFGAGMLREAGILILSAIGLAIGFNLMNTKSLTWIKKDFAKVVATSSEIDTYLAPSSSVPPVATPTKSLAPKPVEAAKPVSFVAQPGMVKDITYDQFVRLMAAGAYYLIDARASDTYAAGYIGNATNFYGGEVQSKIPELLLAVPRDRVILIYCDGGECELSHHVADVLKQFGYGPVFIFTGGWAEWKAKH